MIGPTFEYSDYIDYIYKLGQFAHIPNPVPAVLNELKKSVFFILMYLTLDNLFYVDYIVTQEYANLSLLSQALYVIIIIVVFKFKYYTAWSLASLGIKASGIGYQRYLDKERKQV